MYQRHAGNNYRCCTDRQSELERLRLRAESSGWSPAMLNASVVVVDDSLAEQFFMSTLCLV